MSVQQACTNKEEQLDVSICANLMLRPGLLSSKLHSKILS